MGRPRKLIDNTLGHRTLKEIEVRKDTEQRMTELKSIDTEPPEHLDDIAQAEYRRIVPLLQELPIAALDYAQVSSYCQFYSNWMQATAQMKNQDFVITTAHGVRANPLIAIQRDAHASMASIAQKLGMTIDSRLKIMTPKKEEQKHDPFKEMFNE